MSQGFALAHGLAPGSRVRVLMNGQMRELTVTGTAISPEYVYALGPGDMMPDPRRFGIAWMPDESLAAAFDLAGAFDDVVVKLAPGASEAAVIERLDAILAPYGGADSIGRKDQLSYAFLDAELHQLRNMGRILPPIFLLVAAFLVNMTLSRLVALEREQIGLLKALGYGPWSIAGHYVGFVQAIAAVGIVLGWVAGAWLGAGMARMYARFYDFPFLIFSRSPDTYAIAALITAGAAVGGAVDAVRRVAWLPPAVAMSPPAPVRYRRLWGGALESLLQARQASVMVARHLLRWPLRTGAGVLGIAFAVAVLVASLWSFGAVSEMVDFTFERAEHHDAALVFGEPSPLAALHAVRQMPGVLRVEPQRIVAARMSHGHRDRRVSLAGEARDARLFTLLAPDETPMTPPDHGLILSEALADLLGVGRGDTVAVELLEGDRRRVEVPVSGISIGYVGLSAVMEIGALNRLVGEGAMISGVRIDLDPAGEDAFYAAVKATPRAGFVTIQSRTRQRFRATMAENMTVMLTTFTTLAAIIAFGVVYNFARISLSEQGRELASLRVLGFTRGEVARLLHSEIAAVILLAQPLGWLVGAGIVTLVARGLSSELYRIPLAFEPAVFAKASLIVLAASALSALFIRRRIDRLDLIEVLKTRE